MKCERIICSEKIIVDAADRKLSAINILDDLFFQGFPASIPLMLFIKFSREKGEENQTLFLDIKIDNTQLGKNTLDFSFPDSVNSAGTIVNLGFLPIVHPGNLVIQIVNSRDETLGSLKYNVAQNPTPAQTSLL